VEADTSSGTLSPRLRPLLSSRDALQKPGNVYVTIYSGEIHGKTRRCNLQDLKFLRFGKLGVLNGLGRNYDVVAQ